MPTFVLSTMDQTFARALAEAARQQNWFVYAFDEDPERRPEGKVVYYGGLDVSLAIASKLGLVLLEPPLDLVARLPLEFRRRSVEFGRFADLERLRTPAFVKPADPLNKAFDAGIYSPGMRPRRQVSPSEPILVAEPVEWLAEFRCFVLEGRIVTWSPYLSFGRPNWRPIDPAKTPTETPSHLEVICQRLAAKSGLRLPPAFVVDVGLIEDRGWAVVEFNPAWCSGLLGAHPRKVLAVLERACHHKEALHPDDAPWHRGDEP